MSTLSPADSRCETWSALFYCCSLLLNNNMATNLQRFTSSYDRYCIFPDVVVDLKHLWQVIQRDSEC